MAERERLKDSVVKGLSPPEHGYLITYDTDITGFAVRVMAPSKDESSGTRAFLMNYRVKGTGRERRMTIGKYGDWSVAAAREEAKDLRQRIDRGEDPMGDRHTARKAPTVADLCDRYLEEHLPRKRPSSQAEDRAMIGKIIVPKLGKLKVADVRHADIDALHRKLKATPYRANRVAALLSKIFNLAIKWEYRPDNPVKGLERYQEQRRKRYLSPAELQRLTAALAKHSNQASANVVRLLLLTGARRGEVLGATWDQFDLEAGTWIKPSSMTKQKMTHEVPLSAPALQLLAEMQDKADGPHLFPGKPGEPQAGLKKFWTAICKRAEIKNCRIHDLRHSYASLLASAGVGLLTIGRLLGHTQASTTDRYAHLSDDPLRQATERVGAVITAAGNGGEVVPIRKDQV